MAPSSHVQDYSAYRTDCSVSPVPFHHRTAGGGGGRAFETRRWSGRRRGSPDSMRHLVEPEVREAGKGRAVLPHPEFPHHSARADSSKYYVAGYAAAFLNIIVTFPVNKLMFRQQLHGSLARDALRQLRAEGVRRLYRGLLPPLAQKTTTLALMFGLYEDFSAALLGSRPSGVPEALPRALAAVLAGSAEAALAPFERVQTLLQDARHQATFRNTAHAFRALRAHGVREYYRGLVPILLRNGPSNAIFFGLRGPIKEALPRARTPASHVANDFACGGFLGALLSTLFYPLNVVKVRMQSRVGGDFLGFAQALAIVWQERDRRVSRLFRGVHVNYQRSILSWGIINATYELVLRFL
ncbi:mitochondrial nicotinamide adenine dinucleotide transporter SLC25A51 isoform X1 [Petromyzon marinus]|uniref:Solute carrier family 25 member 51 isoform X1 n=2 Tax=Petromyzon marinus TaxID=7757 RepID=A0AAJ7T519_PETMA|nr:solute carrier family 25 member 51 isoform X1 [Petromyzon marinus]XP_032810975.1 solute carrier family 25 member 51 isoform X1 [Petromyzon marinus]